MPLPEPDPYPPVTKKAQDSTYSSVWGTNDFLGLGYSAKLTENLGYGIVASSIAGGGWAIGNEHSQEARRIYVEIIVKTGYRGFYWASSGRLVLRERSAIDYQVSGTQRVVAYWQGTLFPNEWIAFWFNSDADSGSTEQPIGAPLEWFVREQVGEEDVSAVQPTHPPYRHRLTRDAYDWADIVYYDKPAKVTPQPDPVVGPASGTYRILATGLGTDTQVYTIYREFLHQYPSRWDWPIWVINVPASGGSGKTMYYSYDTNQPGWLRLGDTPSLDLSNWSLVYFYPVSGSKYALGVPGKGYLGWATSGSVGKAYTAPFYRFTYVNDVSAAIGWSFIAV